MTIPPPAPEAAGPTAILDAVCCVHFCAAGKHGLLLGLLDALDWQILVPDEVSTEVQGNARKYPTVAVPWKKFIANDRVTVLEKIDLDNPRHELVRRKVAELRGMSQALAIGTPKDLGEYIVVGHGTVLADAGREVYVLIDDGDGQDLALSQGLAVVDVERLLLLGHRLRLTDLDTKAKVKNVYDQLRKFGASLVDWKSSWLKAQF